MEQWSILSKTLNYIQYDKHPKNFHNISIITVNIGQINNNKPNVEQYLTREQANFVYKKTELGEIINTETLQQELKHKRQLNRIDDTSREIN